MKLISICLLLAVFATPAAALDDYRQFLVPASEAGILYSAAYADCIEASGGVTANMQDCMAAEYERLSPQLESAFAAAMGGTAEPAALEQDQAAWLETRWQQCEADSAAGGGGSASSLMYESCALDEVVRRILWLEEITD